MSGTSFTEKVITATVQMVTGNVGSSDYNTIQLSGLRMVASIAKRGSPSFDVADLRIYGMTESVMNQCSTLGTTLANVAGRNNIVTISAGDVSGVSVVFKGTVRAAYQNLDDVPDTSFSFHAIAGGFDAINPIPPTSYSGGVDVATIMAGLANQINRILENNGVSVILFNPYLTGTAIDQIHDCARHANIEVYIDNDVVAIWPKDGVRKSDVVPEISPRTGMIGYPRYSDAGIQFRTLFNPNLHLGSNVQIQSSILRAAGPWQISQLTYNLACQVPQGPWFCDCCAIRLIGGGGVAKTS